MKIFNLQQKCEVSCISVLIFRVKVSAQEGC